MKQENYIKKSLLWDITRRCNLSCIHCYNSGGISTEQELEIAPNYKAIIDRVVQAGFNHIHLLGGEPLLVKGLLDLLYYANIKGILISINTNGTLLTQKLINELIESNVSQLTFSLDGATESSNDAIRGSGNYKRVTENIKQTISCIEQAKSTMLVQVATVVTKQNISTIHKLPKVLRNMGVKYLDVLKLYECGNAVSNESFLQLKSEEYLAALCKLLVESYRNQIFAQFDCKPKVLELLNLRYGFQPEYNISEFASCNAGKRFLFMDYKGDIYPCGPFAHEVANTELTTNIFDKDCIEQLTKIEESIHDRIYKFSSLPSPVCSNCQFNECCSGCAICYKGHDELCNTALRLYSV